MTLSSDGTFRVKGAGTAGSTDAFQVAGTAPADSMVLNSSGNLGVGTASPAVRMHVQGSAGQLMRVTDGTTGASIYSGGGLFGFNNQTGEDGMFGSTTSHYLYFATNGAERMRLDSVARLSLLTANGQMGFASGNTASGVKIQAFNAAGNADGYLAFEGFTKEYGRFSDDGTFRVKGAGTAGSTDAFQVAGTAPADSMVLNSSGNLGVGTASPAVKLDVVGQGRFLYGTGATNTGDQNVVTVGATTTGAYASSYGAGLQFQITNSSGGYSGSRIVSRLNADNNTANLIFQARNYGFSDSMTLDASGNLGVGVATPTVRLDVLGVTNLGSTTSATLNLFRRSTIPTTGTNIGTLSFASTEDGTTLVSSSSIISQATENWSGSGTGSNLLFRTNTIGQVGPSTKMTLDSAGNLGIGVATPAYKLDVDGTAAISGAVTLSGGTANGVAFLNASKVLTTGSALTFDGTNLGNSQNTAAPIGLVLSNSSVSTSAGTQLTFKYGATTTGYVGNQFDGGDFNTQYMAAQHHIWFRGATEGMRLTSSLLSVVPGATIQGLTVGRGAGAVSTNTAVGASALASNTSGASNTALGGETLFSNTTGNSNIAVGGRDDGSWTPLYSNTTGSYNLAVGNGSLAKNTTASNNTAVGYQAGFSNTTGFSGVFIGTQAGYANTTGQGNVLVGQQAGYTLSTGSGVTAIGFNAISANTSTASNNTALGSYTLRANTTGTMNTALGGGEYGVEYGALGYNTTGSYNTAVGHYALKSNTTASSNTAVGYQAGYLNTTGEYLVAMGSLALYSNTTGYRNVGVGFQALYSNTTGFLNTAVGMQVLTGNTTGSYNVAIGNEALVSNTTASYNTAVGYQAGYSNTTGQFNAFFGRLAGYTNNGNSNTGIGNGALYLTSSGTDNSAVGSGAMEGNTTGVNNSAIGSQALYTNATGSYNTGLGAQALRSNTTASNNTAVGYQAGYNNTTGANNIYIGFTAGYYQQAGASNTAVGYQAFQGNSTPANNTGVSNSAFGQNALLVNSSGSYNTAIGQNSLQANTTATNNTAVGYQAGYTNVTGVANCFFGYLAGYSSTGSGNTFVGAGGSGGQNPAGYLSTGSDNNFLGSRAGGGMTTGSKNTILGNYNGNQGGLDIRTSSNYIVLSDGDGNPRGIFDGSGNFGLGVTSPTVKLDVLGVTNLGSTTSATLNLFRRATIPVIGTNIGTLSFASTQDGTTLSGSSSIISQATEDWAGSGTGSQLLFRTNTIGTVGPSTKMTLTSDGNLLVGTTSANGKLTVSSGATTLVASLASTGTNTYTQTVSTSLVNSTLQLFGGGGSGTTTGIRMSQGGSFELFFGGVQEAGGAAAYVWQGYSGTAYAERMRLDSSGNLFLGRINQIDDGQLSIETLGSNNSLITTTWKDVQFLSKMYFSSSFYLGIRADAANREIALIANSSDSSAKVAFYTGASGTPTERGRFSSDGTFRVKGAGTAGSTDAFQVAGTAPADAARIDSSGNLLVGTTTVAPGAANSVLGASIGNSNGGYLSASRDGNVSLYLNRNTSDGDVALFCRQGAVVGSISVTTLLTAYNTTSDYRLKTVIGPVANAGQRIDALQPVEYTWNSNGSRTRGFLAHQFQEVYAGSVTGTKDAVDAEGKPVYQAMQASTSEVIADLVAELQSLRARVAALEAA
jgi:hypothetical protein